MLWSPKVLWNALRGVMHVNWIILGMRNTCRSPNLGLTPRQGFARLWAKREAQESYLVLPRMQKSVKEWTLTLPSELPLWELESQWTPEPSEGDRKGQNPSVWRVLYIIEKLLKRRCLKWARMTHLDIWNTSYGQKKSREWNW
jgi:hypothetical protein